MKSNKRREGDDGLHVALCYSCGTLWRGSYGIVETEAAIHRSINQWHHVVTGSMNSSNEGTSEIEQPGENMKEISNATPSRSCAASVDSR
jgi:hypothetical protein